MSKGAVTITHAEALRLIDEQIGERVYLGVLLAPPEAGSDDSEAIRFVERQGRLSNPLAPRPPRTETNVGLYGFGREGIDSYPFPPMAETIQLRDNGIDFLLAGGSSIRIAWRGSSEVGDGPDAGKLGRLRLLGIAREGESAGDDASLDLQRFLAEARRAKAEVLSANPTDFSFENKTGEKRRIWELTVRVMPADESAFEATAEVAWPRIGEIEERLERGELLTGVPAETEVLEVAFEPGNREQVMAFPADEDSGEPLRFRAMVVGRAVRSVDDDVPTEREPTEVQEGYRQGSCHTRTCP
jgi:hypothetical protein